MKLRARQSNLLIHILLIQRKRLLEHTTQLLQLLLERFLVCPCQRGVQQLSWDALEVGRDRKAKDGERLILCLGELTGMHGVDDAASEPEGAALALAEFTASPAGVDEPAVNLVLRHTFGKHLGVAAGLDEKFNNPKGREWEDNLRAGQ